MYHHPHEQTQQQPSFPPQSYKEHEDGIFQRTEEPSERQTDDLHRKLQTLNIELRCAGMQQIRICPCDHQAVESCIKSIRALISDGAQMKTRLKVMQQTANEQRNTRMQREREKEHLAAEKENLLRERDTLAEKLRALNREVRQREEKMKNERQGFAKERRLWGQKQESMRKQSAHLEDNARRLTEQLKKINNKNDKNQYRNVFQVFVPVSNRMQERELEFTVTNTIQQHTRVLSQEAESMKEALKEVFGRLQKIAVNLDHQQVGEHYRPQIIDLPITGKNTYIEHLRRFLTVIEDRAEELRTRQGEADPTELIQTVNKLKGFFSSYEAINQGRQAIMDRMFSVARERENLGNLSKLIEKRQREEEKEEERRGEAFQNETEKYVDQRIAYFENEFKRFDRFNRSLEEMRENPLQLTEQE